MRCERWSEVGISLISCMQQAEKAARIVSFGHRPLRSVRAPFVFGGRSHSGPDSKRKHHFSDVTMILHTQFQLITRCVVSR